MNQVTQLTKMLDALLEGEMEDPDLVECCFLEALYCSLGASLLDEGRARFDEGVKRLASLPSADTEGVWANPGELPGGDRVPPVSLRRILRVRFPEGVILLSRVCGRVGFPACLLLWRNVQRSVPLAVPSGEVPVRHLLQQKPKPLGWPFSERLNSPSCSGTRGWHSIWGRVNFP